MMKILSMNKKMSMEKEQFAIEGLLLLKPDVYRDDRGYFLETFNEDRYREFGIPVEKFVQDNLSQSKKGVVRGLHYQKAPYEQGKLVQVFRGCVLDVAVDIRPESPTYGQYVMVELSDKNHYQFWIPAGFAHGFLSLEDDTVFSYKCTNVYSKEHEGGILWNDPAIGIEWGIVNPIVSEKDAMLPFLKDISKEI